MYLIGVHLPSLVDLGPWRHAGRVRVLSWLSLLILLILLLTLTVRVAGGTHHVAS